MYGFWSPYGFKGITDDLSEKMITYVYALFLRYLLFYHSSTLFSGNLSNLSSRVYHLLAIFVDFLDIWLNSIHGHSDRENQGTPPVILVGTHADKLNHVSFIFR